MTQYTQLKWPTCGPDFNTWYCNLPLFVHLLEIATDVDWWVADTKCKYLNIRVDTRNAAFLVFSANNNEQVRVSPDEVLNTILKAIFRYDEDKALKVKEIPSLPELVLFIQKIAMQYKDDKTTLYKKVLQEPVPRNG